MLETAAAAGRAATVPAVEAELAGGVAALLRQGRGGKLLADGIPGADIADRVGACRLADGRLVHKHHIGQVVHTQQAVVRARCFRRLAELAQQRGRQHVLDQRGLAGAAHASHAHQALQRDFQRDILQVVGAHAFQQQARRVGLDCARLPALRIDHLLAPAQVGARQRVGALECIGRAVEHDIAATLTRAGAHVDHAVRRPHHGRVMLHHHQRVTRIAQAQHGLGDAVHVARMQADAGLVQHKQRVHQRGAQRSGQVDTLHLATAERAALAVQREVADAHIAQIAQARVDFLEQQLACLRVGGIGAAHGVQLQLVEEGAQPVDRQHHEIMQTKTRQGLQSFPIPINAFWHESP